MTLCTACRRSLLSRLQATSRTLRYASSVSTSNPPTDPNPPPSDLTQSFSTPNTSAPTTTHSSSSTSHPPPQKKPPQLLSSIPGGTELRGLGYLKTKPTVLAKEDDEYPSWLWTLLSQPKAGESPSAGPKVDVSTMTKRQRLKHDRKQEKLLSTLPPTIPLHEQSKDLTGSDDSAVVSLERRQEITKSARVARRKGIREANFLKGM